MTWRKHYGPIISGIINEHIETELCLTYLRMRSQTNKKLNDLSERLDDKFRHLQLKTDNHLKINCKIF